MVSSLVGRMEKDGSVRLSSSLVSDLSLSGTTLRTEPHPDGPCSSCRWLACDPTTRPVSSRNPTRSYVPAVHLHSSLSRPSE